MFLCLVLLKALCHLQLSLMKSLIKQTKGTKQTSELFQKRIFQDLIAQLSDAMDDPTSEKV